MPSLTAQERLQPSLLDRLLDDEPDHRKESLEDRVMTKQALRQAVLRDLGWLFNVTNLSDELEPDRYPQSIKSVVNFGLPPLSGQYASTVQRSSIERAIRDAILEFEPRLLGHTVQVELIMDRSVLDMHNQVSVRIRGMLWAQPVPLEILLRTEIDLEEGRIQVMEAAG